MEISLSHYLVLASVLFTIGAIGVVVRRNVLTIIMSIELMLNAANLTFIAFARFPVNANVTGVDTAMNGHASAFFVIAVAAAEAAVGLAILIAVFRKRQTARADDLRLLQDVAPRYDDAVPVLPAHAQARTGTH